MWLKTWMHLCLIAIWLKSISLMLLNYYCPKRPKRSSFTFWMNVKDTGTLSHSMISACSGWLTGSGMTREIYWKPRQLTSWNLGVSFTSAFLYLRLFRQRTEHFNGLDWLSKTWGALWMKAAAPTWTKVRLRSLQQLQQRQPHLSMQM